MITSPENYSMLISPQKTQKSQQSRHPLPSQLPNKSKQKSQKDALITKLQSTNQKLKSQIYKIQRQLQQRAQYQTLVLQSMSKRQSLFSSDNLKMLQKQLSNAYKHITFYQHQIKKLTEEGHSLNFQSKRSSIQVIIRQKKQLLIKIKDKYNKEVKITDDNDKKLTNNNIKHILDQQLQKLNKDARIAKQKLVEFQRVEKYKKQNMIKQNKAIKKFQNQLLEAGIANGGLDQIKQRAMRGIPSNNNNNNNYNISNRKQSKNSSIILNAPKNNNSIMYNNSNSKIIDKNIKNNNNSNPNIKINSLNNSKLQQSQEQMDNDRSYQTYIRQTNQISLLDKIVNDFQKMMNQAEKEKQQAVKLNSVSKQQLEQCQHQIQILEKYMIELKGKINPINLKPTKGIKEYRSMTTKPSDNPAKIINQTPLLVKMPIIVKNKSISHILKHDQIGFPSQKGDKFTDRQILGKTFLKSKIIGAKVYISKYSNIVIGLQMIYSGNKRGGQYIKRQVFQQLYLKQQFQCSRPHYIKNIYGSLTSENKLSNITFVSSNKMEYKFGVVNNSKKFDFQFQDDQYPTCLYGSLIVGKENNKYMSFIQYLGVEIQKQDEKDEKK